ncbi:alpha/beta hydrolase [Nocardioides mangrovicus]|uniref:Alpha/beta hydrolase n=1 Tax=Nocardioides mangrovicus TaxID=2478913 RepID=A0A3L8NYE6_9ACTN|nr:alpha/beta hydrolase [Nocardioides mangrovicus]RLV48185.1 alpha/beta hydrolase [Nocardioides mangrovicus]
MSGPRRVDVDSVGGTRIAAYRWDPDGDPVAAVQVSHGMGEHAQRYAPLAEVLTRHGYVVYAQDHRGHGASIVDGVEAGVIGADGWTELVRDIDRLRDRIEDAHPGLPVAHLGHSMGSFAAQQDVLDHSRDLSALLLTGTAAIDLLEPALDLDQPLDLTAFNAPFAPARTDYDWLSRDEHQVDLYVEDPLCGFGLDTDAGRQMFTAAREVADPARLAEIRGDLPVYIAVGELDPVNAQLTVVRPLVERLEAAGLEDVTFVTYPEARHEIFNETNRSEVVAGIVAWLGDRLT